MINNLNVIAIIPARGGSKGVKLKNLRTVCGVPLVATVGRVIKSLSEIDRSVVSTDHEEIARVAEDAGISAPFRRPEELSGDRVGDIEVLTHALLETELIDNVTYDIIVMLQPTSPLRESKHVSDAINMLVDEGWDAVWTVSETDSKSHPLKQLIVNNNRLDYYDSSGSQIIARQQLKPIYHRNGIAYIITRECLLGKKSIKGDNTGALIIKGEHVSIDTEWDLSLVEFILSKRKGVLN
ncbi:acylneuraminate cytidylyltransferase family protein [bacterium]|jgi:CMP-N-acetylneuraminic acid synthetase|nr:acylneuraminate cytidylyltransferase family protein [bacterium]